MKFPDLVQPVLKAALFIWRAPRAACREGARSDEELGQMEERGLRDLGIGRSEIPYWLGPNAVDERGG